ncbi:MAG: alcohol dehydrogenase catalytic domain-containing protein [Deltaproteobacteria bacterium]|nr:alcohol dehydrogenase catalytic domain-containing protein [Deltaproteobacteria bacterium]MBW2153475.1 alcohol dehydrogenase catalytic domain-containing protein [Deltaproteobacteria bacterium]
MLAVVKYPDRAGVVLEDAPVPEYSPFEVLIKVKAVGICGSDVRIYNMIYEGKKKKFIIGHELSGEVVKWGEKVHRFHVGDRVATEICIGCAICSYCKKGLINLCDKLEEIGVTMSGGMAEYISIPARNVHRLAENISFEAATLADPLACTIRGLEMAQIRPDTWVAILGPGAMGLLATQVAKRIRRTKVVVVGTRENRLELAREFGADHTVNLNEVDPVEAVLDITDGGADYTFEAAGSSGALSQSFAMTRRNGSVVIFTVHRKIEVDMEPVIRNELTVSGSICYNYREFEIALDLLGKEKIDVAPLLQDIVPLKDAQEAFRRVIERKTVKCIIKP